MRARAVVASDIHADTRLIFEQRPSDVPEDTHIVEVWRARCADRSQRAHRGTLGVDGCGAVERRGIPTVCSAGDIALAHAARSSCRSPGDGGDGGAEATRFGGGYRRRQAGVV